MRAWAIAVALLFALSSASRAEDCTLKEFVSLDMGDAPNRAVVVPATLGGKQLHFLVDTGGTYSWLASDVADGLGLSAKPLDKNYYDLYTSDGQSPAQYVNAPDFQIGPIQLHRFAMLLAPRGNPKIDGILAPDFLSQADLEFDFAHGKLNLFSQDHCPGKVVYWSPGSFAEVDFKYFGSHILLPATLDGHAVEAILDTGATKTFLSEEFSHRVMGVDQKTPGVELAPEDGVSADFSPFRYRFASLSIGGLAVRNPMIYITADRAEKAFRQNHTRKSDYDPIYGSVLDYPRLVLGMDVLKQMRIFVSYKEKKLYFTSADTPDKP